MNTLIKTLIISIIPYITYAQKIPDYFSEYFYEKNGETYIQFKQPLVNGKYDIITKKIKNTKIKITEFKLSEKDKLQGITFNQQFGLTGNPHTVKKNNENWSKWKPHPTFLFLNAKIKNGKLIITKNGNPIKTNKHIISEN